MFDACGNATYATLWSFFFFLIYAAAQLFIVRARVRNFKGNVKSWTQLYGTGLIVGGVLVLMTTLPALAEVVQSPHNVINFVFNKLMIFLIVYLSIYKVPKGGHMIMLPEFFQKFKVEKVSLPSKENSQEKRGSK